MTRVSDKRNVAQNKCRRLTKRALDWWESARFQALCAASSWFRQNNVLSSRPPASNASCELEQDL